VNPSNYLKIKNQIPSNVNILAVSKGFKSQEIKTIQNIGQNDFGESKFQEAFEKQLILKDLKKIKWHFIGRIQSNKVRKIVQNFKYIHSVDSFEKLQKISNISFEVISKGAAQSWQMENRHKTMIEDKFDYGFAVDWMRKDLKIAMDEAKKNNSPLPITKIIDEFYAEVQKMGGQRWDTSSLIKRFRK